MRCETLRVTCGIRSSESLAGKSNPRCALQTAPPGFPIALPVGVRLPGCRRTPPPAISRPQGERAGEEAILDEESIMKLAESLPPEDRSKALKLWEENKKMRRKLAVLESVALLPPHQQIQALSMLKQNNSSRQQTGMNKVQTWDSLQQAVDRLRMDADKELLDASPAVGSDDGLSGAAAPANGSTDGSGAGSWKDNAQSISQAPEEYGGDPREKVVEYDSTWRFWNTGLGSTGIMKLVVADAALELALFKAETMAAADVDQIINNYWARELQGAKPAPSVMPQADVQVAAEEAPSRRLDAPSLATAELPTKGSAALDAEAPKAEAANPSLSPAQPPSPPPPEASPPAEVSEPAVVGGTNSLQGGMLAAAAGLGAGMLALAVGMEATAAMEIMAATAIVTSAGALMGSNDAASNLKMKGAGAPALVAIATALNAADTLTKKIDKALESERARTVSEVAASTAKMFAVVGRNAVSSIGSVASGGREATADENREAPVQPEEGKEWEASILFSIRRQLQPGERLKVVGSTDELGAWDGSLGAWDADLSLAMHCHGGDVWLAAAQGIRAGTLEFAFAVVSDDTGEFTWEAPLSGNRVIQVPGETSLIHVTCTWEDAERVHVLLNEDAVEDFDAGLAAIESSMEGAHSLVLALGESAVPEDDRKYTTSKASGPSVVNHDSSSTEISMAAAALEDAHKLSSIAGDKDGADAKGQSSKAGIQAQPAGEAAGPFPNEDLEGPKQVTALSRAAADEEQAPAAEADAKACEAGSEILAPGQPENEKPAPGKAALSSPVAQLETAPVADVPGAEGAVDGLLTEVHADQEQAAQSWPPWDAQEEAPESEREETSASAESAADNAALEVVEAQLDANSVPEEEAVEELAGETQGPVAPQPELSAEPRQEPVEEASKNASVPVEATDDESGRASVSYLSSAQATGFGVGSSMTPEAPADQGRNVADTDAAEAVLEVPADTQEPTSEGRAEDPEVKRAEPFEAAPKAAEAAVDASPVLMATEESPSGGLDVEVVLAAADEQREDSAAAAPVSLAEPRGGAVQKSLVMPPGAESMGDKPADTGAALEFCSEETSEEITGSDPLEAQDVELAEALEQAQRAEDSTATADTEMGGNPPIASGEMGAEGEDAAMQLAEEAARVELEAAVNLGRGFADHHTDTAAEIPSVVEAGSEGGLEDAPGEKTSDGSETLPGNPTQEATPDLSAEPQAVEGLLTDPNTEDAGGQAEDMGKASVPPASSGVETRGQEVQQNSKDEDPEEAWVKPSPKGAAAGATSRQAVTPSLPAGEFEDTQAFAMFLEAIASSQDSRLGSSSLFSAESVDVHGGDPDATPMGDETLADQRPPTHCTTVNFVLCKELVFGQRLKVVGSCAELGNWDTEKALPMKWHEGHVWKAAADIPQGSVEFKFVVALAETGGALYWETLGASNRVLEVVGGASSMTVTGDFGNMGHMDVTVDEDPDRP